MLIRAWVHIQGNKVTLGELKCHLISYNAMLLINLLYVVCVFGFYYCSVKNFLSWFNNYGYYPMTILRAMHNENCGKVQPYIKHMV